MTEFSPLIRIIVFFRQLIIFEDIFLDECFKNIKDFAHVKKAEKNIYQCNSYTLYKIINDDLNKTIKLIYNE